MDETRKKLYEATYQLETAKGRSAYLLQLFGDYIANREGYRSHSQLDAVHFYLIQKHSWTPATVKSMSSEDLQFCLAEEMRDWRAPAGAIFKD